MECGNVGVHWKMDQRNIQTKDRKESCERDKSDIWFYLVKGLIKMELIAKMTGFVVDLISLRF